MGGWPVIAPEESTGKTTWSMNAFQAWPLWLLGSTALSEPYQTARIARQQLEHKRQLDVDDEVVADVIERIVGLARFANPIKLGHTWHKLLASLTTDQLLDLKRKLRVAIAA